MIIIAVINQKGGVGKTTSVINLGYSFHLLGFKTLLVDLDPQANLTSGLGQSKTHAENVENFLRSETITPLQIYDQLFLIPGCEELISFEREVLTKEQREYYLKNALAGQQEFQLVLIDTPPALGILAINALVASNLVLIPVQAEYYALEGLTSLLKTIDFVKQNCNQTLTCLGIFLT
ncbi:MAG: AAA family ATPase, partial [Deltaproteobacteria bacterium]|nr:AAA family ATPase [Deltaproteobacteria bacterium]